MRVKICGITNIEDALKCVYYGANALGFIFYKKSPRYVSPSKVRKIIEMLPPFVTPVAVFVNPKEREVRDVCSFSRINTIQLHGNEDPSFCKRFKNFKIIKAFHADKLFNLDIVKRYKVDAYLFDTYNENKVGGTGITFNWDVIKNKSFDKPFILSGGLNENNIKEAISIVNPYAIDVSSGIERMPGIKDHKLIRSFFLSLNS